MAIRSYTLGELANYLQAELKGDVHCTISGVASIEKAQAGQITFLHDTRYRAYLKTTKASVVILNAKHADIYHNNRLIMQNPYLGFAKAATLFDNKPKVKPGIHPTAVLGADCQIGENVSVGANCTVGDHVKIGANSIIHPNTVIGDHCSIGVSCTLWSNVTIYYNVCIGSRVMIHSGCVVGSDGFGIVNDKGKWFKIPQLGSVEIGDDVEIGANTAIDRGALEDTVIQRGVKLDNLVQVAHNVNIGEDTAIAGCTAIAGSTHIGKNCIIAGGSSISGHLKIADKVILTGTAGVPASIDKPGIYSSGTGLQETHLWKRNMIRFQQLDTIARRVKKLEKVLR